MLRHACVGLGPDPTLGGQPPLLHLALALEQAWVYPVSTRQSAHTWFSSDINPFPSPLLTFQLSSWAGLLGLLRQTSLHFALEVLKAWREVIHGHEDERGPSALLGRLSSLPFPNQLHQPVLEARTPIFKLPPPL